MLHFPTCRLFYGYAYYTTQVLYPQQPVDHMSEAISTAKERLKQEMLFHLAQSVGQLIEQRLYIDLEKLHQTYDAELVSVPNV